jgi:hypothetical protein
MSEQQTGILWNTLPRPTPGCCTGDWWKCENSSSQTVGVLRKIRTRHLPTLNTFCAVTSLCTVWRCMGGGGRGATRSPSRFGRLTPTPSCASERLCSASDGLYACPSRRLAVQRHRRSVRLPELEAVQRHRLSVRLPSVEKRTAIPVLCSHRTEWAVPLPDYRHGAQCWRSWQLFSRSTNSLHVIQTAGSSPRSQEPARCVLPLPHKHHSPTHPSRTIHFNLSASE